GTSKTSILEATTGSLNVPSYNKDDSFIGSLSGVFNSTSGSDKITVYFSIGNGEQSAEITTTETGNIPFRIDYEINFPIAREANVSGIITLGKESAVLDLDYQIITGLTFDISAELTGGELKSNSSYLHRNYND